VRDAIRKGAAENEVEKHEERLTGAWRQISTLEHLDWIQKFLRSCVQDRAEQDNINHPAYGTWTAEFMLRQNENDLRVPWRHKRREIMAMAGIILAAKWLAKIKQRSDVGCRLCKRAREQRGASTEDLPICTVLWWQLLSNFLHGQE